VADWRGLERHRGWQLEDWGVERQELSGGDIHSFHHITPFRREFLTGTRLERTRHGLRLHRLVGHDLAIMRLVFSQIICVARDAFKINELV